MSNFAIMNWIVLLVACITQILNTFSYRLNKVKFGWIPHKFLILLLSTLENSIRIHWTFLSVSVIIYSVKVGIQQETCRSRETEIIVSTCTRHLFEFPSIVLRKTEDPKAMNMCYSFQPLMGFCSHFMLIVHKIQ